MTDAEALEVLDTLEEVVKRECADEGLWGSPRLADALRLLARHGRFEIILDRGRTVSGKWVQP